MFINDFQNQKVIFKNLSLKFFNNKQSFNLDQVNGEILYSDRKIKKIKTQVFIGEVPFEIIFKESQLDLISKKIGINLSLKNIFEKEKNLKLIGINFKDKKVNAYNFLKELGNPYDISLRDSDGTDSITFGVYGVPESILINKEHKIVKKFISPISPNDYDNILKLVNEKYVHN